MDDIQDFEIEKDGGWRIIKRVSTHYLTTNGSRVIPGIVKLPLVENPPNNCEAQGHQYKTDN